MFGLLGRAAGAAFGVGGGKPGMGTPQYKGPKGQGTPGFAPAMDASTKPPKAAPPLLSKPPSDMQGQGRTAPDTNTKMDGGAAQMAARFIGRRGSSF